MSSANSPPPAKGTPAGPPAPTGYQRFKRDLGAVLGVVMCLFTLIEVNYPTLGPQAALAIFAMLGMVLCFLYFPLHPRF